MWLPSPAHPAARYSSTAFTRRLTSISSDSPSLEKIEFVCFSTARVDSTRDDAMAALRRGLEAYVRVARSRSDVAAIALVNQSYRELFQRRWSVKTWGY